MKPDVQILQYLKQHPDSGSAQIVILTGLSRQKAAAHLSRLLAAGKVERSGSTKNARYRLAHGKIIPSRKSVELIRSLAGLAEDRVFDEIDLRLSLRKILPENVYRIAYYTFTEMLNNAIDHSKAKKATIGFELAEGKVCFAIRDAGIGAFANVMKKFRLSSEFEALEHLVKGKQTTFPEQHSGQGIFFTSRIADRFIMRSHRLQYTVDNKLKDIFVAEKRNQLGTEVRFEILQKSRKTLKSIFDEYSNEEFEFDRANFRVKLTAGREYLSRSQAKRIVSGLEAYRKIILDFSGVQEIGQGFADEIFRVFQSRNPKTDITFTNANSAVSGMILRVIREAQSQKDK